MIKSFNEWMDSTNEREDPTAWMGEFLPQVHNAKSEDDLPDAEEIKKRTGKTGEDLEDAVDALKIIWRMRRR